MDDPRATLPRRVTAMPPSDGMVEETKPDHCGAQKKVPSSLQRLCQCRIVKLIERTTPRGGYGRLINELCKYVPNILTEPIFEMLLEKGRVISLCPSYFCLRLTPNCLGLITEASLMSFLVPSRNYLKLRQAVNIRNSIFKQIGYNCPNLVRKL